METAEREIDRRTRDIWIRGAFMVLFIVAIEVAQTLLFLLATVQFVWLLFSRKPNQLLLRFGSSLSKWYSHAILFLACSSEEKPFPWKEWPAAD